MPSSEVVKNSLLATGKGLLSVGGVITAFSAVSEYKESRKERHSVGASIAKTAFTNVLPGILLNGPNGLLYQSLIYGAPAVPALVQAVGAISNARESYIRKSAMPFTEYGYSPTIGAIQSMQRAFEASTGLRGLSQTHAALASQAMRR